MEDLTEMRTKLGEGIQNLLYTIVHFEKAVNVEQIADTASCAPSTVYEYLNDKPIVPLAIIKAVYELTGDARIRRVIEPKGFRLDPETANRESGKSLERDLLDVHRAISRLDENMERALSPESEGGEGLTPQEIGRVETLIDQVKAELADVESHLGRVRATARPRAVVR